MSYQRSWSDQPEFLVEGHRIASFKAGEEHIEIVKVAGNLYLTAGNLFRSQTVSVDDYEVLLQVIEAIAGPLRAEKVTLPKGARLVQIETGREVHE